MSNLSAVDALVAQTEREIASQKTELKRSLGYVTRFVSEVQEKLDSDHDIYENLNIANAASEVRAITARIAVLTSQLASLQVAIQIDGK